MLEIRGLRVAYGKHAALDGFDADVSGGEMVAVLGANGAGKSSLLGALGGLLTDLRGALFAHHDDRQLCEVANHGLDVAPDVPDLGELARLDLDERRVGQSGQTSGNFCFADAGGADHQNVLRHHFGAEFFRQMHATPAIAQRQGNGFLGTFLANDMAVQFGNNVPRGKVCHEISCPRLG